MTDNISKKDKKDWENFISGDQKLPNKDIKYNKKVSLKTKSIDLHGYTLEQANQTIEEFIKKNELLGRFGQAGLQRKKTPNCHK